MFASVIMVQMQLELLREVAIQVAASEQTPEAREPKCFSDVNMTHLRGSRTSSLPMTPETRSQFLVSAASCFRPAREIE